jgi:hypothetical protein
MGAPYGCDSSLALSQVKSESRLFWSVVLSRLQVFARTGGFDTCNLPNMERDKTALISMLTTDLTLVFIMFLGSFRLRGRGGGMFGLGLILWKQVRWCHLVVFVVLSIQFLFVRVVFGSCLP